MNRRLVLLRKLELRSVPLRRHASSMADLEKTIHPWLSFVEELKNEPLSNLHSNGVILRLMVIQWNICPNS